MTPRSRPRYTSVQETSRRGRAASAHRPRNNAECVTWRWPKRRSMEAEGLKTCPMADLGVSASGSSEPTPAARSAAPEGGASKQVNTNSANRMPKLRWVGAIIGDPALMGGSV